jgi:5,5'-dehydrodivanillate O-demethylase
MLATDDNLRLAQVGPGTPGGELLRRYWHPICPTSALVAGAPPLATQLLGERIVLARTRDGGLVALPERCPHRAVSLAYGYVEEATIRCAYHGWRFDADGHCTERPFESAAPSAACHTVGYATREISGLVFVALQPRDDPPPFPLWDILVRDDAAVRIDLQEDLACNWLQVQENAADVTHTVYLHAHALRAGGIADASGFDLPLVEFGFQPFEHGIVKSWSYADQNGGPHRVGWGNPLVFPTMLRIETEMHWRVPLDDVTTRVIILAVDPGRPHEVSVRQLPRRRDGTGRYTMADFYSQDAMAWETQGALADRSREVLGASDVGIAQFRDQLRAAIDACAAGGALPAQGPGDGRVIDLRAWMGGYLPMSAPPDPTAVERLAPERIFDARHRSYQVPGVAGV